MPNRNDYPRTVQEILVESRKYKPAVLAAVRAFRRAKPWRGTTAERIEKFRQLNQALASAYGISVPTLRVKRLNGRTPGNGCYVPFQHVIVLEGTLSVVTYLHEFAHALGKNERQACIWSVNLFRRMFPRSWSRCTFEGYLVVQRRDAE